VLLCHSLCHSVTLHGEVLNRVITLVMSVKVLNVI